MAARCPICSMELADVNAVRQHTRAEHGAAAQDGSEGWTSVAGPGPAGWYPDPWNSKSQRFWDGSQWSGKTAPLDAPPEPAMAAAATGRGRGRGRSVGDLGAHSTAGLSDASGTVPPPAFGDPDTSGAPFDRPAASVDGAAAAVDAAPGSIAPPAAAFDAAPGSYAPPAGAFDANPGSYAPPVGAVDAAPGSYAPPAGAVDAAPGLYAPPAGGRSALPPPPVGDLGLPPSTPPLAPAVPPLGPPPGGPAPKAGGSRAATSPPPGSPGSLTSLARRLPPAVWGAIAAAVVVLVIVIVISGVSSSSSPQPVGIPPTNPVTTAPAGPTGLAAGVLTAGDVGTGWTAYPAGHALTAAQAAAGPCHSPLWNGNLGGYESSFINGTTASAAHGAVVSEVFEAKSAGAAVAQQQFIASSAFLSCLEQKVTAEVESQFPKGAGWAVTGDVANPFQLQLGDASATGWVLMVSVRDGFGSTSVLTDDSVEIFTGPYEATLDVSWNSKAPLTQQIVQAQATTEAAHLAALPVGGTLAPAA